MTQASPFTAELYREYRELKPRVDAAIEEHRRSNLQEADLKELFERRRAESLLRTDGPADIRKAQSVIDSAALYRRYLDCVAVRRASYAAMEVIGKQLEAIKALSYAHNRELQTLGG